MSSLNRISSLFFLIFSECALLPLTSVFPSFSDSDEKPLKGSLRSLNIKGAESADSLVDYGEGDHRMFNEDGSFIGAYAGCKEKASVESIGSSTATFPLHA